MNRQKVFYEPEDDVLNIWFPRKSGKRIDYAEDENGVIIHYTKDGEPVYVEILDASRFFRQAHKPHSSKIENISIAIPHKIK